jgi:hypothetical protein
MPYEYYLFIILGFSNRKNAGLEIKEEITDSILMCFYSLFNYNTDRKKKEPFRMKQFGENEIGNM